MREIRKYANGRSYECRPDARSGVFYIYWSEGRRSCRKSTRTRSVLAAQAFLEEWLRLEEAAGADEPTIADLWDAKYGGDASRPGAAWAHLRPVFGHLTPSQVTQSVEDSYRRNRAQAGISPSTLRFELACLRAVWNHAVKRRRLDPASAPVLDPLPAASPPRDRWLERDETERLLVAAEGNPRVWAFLHLALHTAARRSAIQDLRWSQVDFHVGVIHYLPPGAHQTRKRKASVPISSALLPILEELRLHKRDGYVIGAGGKINEPLRLIAKKAGVEGVTPHVLRHTAATYMAQAGVPLWDIAQILGNTVEQVEKVYAKWQPQRHRAAVDAIFGARELRESAQIGRHT